MHIEMIEQESAADGRDLIVVFVDPSPENSDVSNVIMTYNLYVSNDHAVLELLSTVRADTREAVPIPLMKRNQIFEEVALYVSSECY